MGGPREGSRGGRGTVQDSPKTHRMLDVHAAETLRRGRERTNTLWAYSGDAATRNRRKQPNPEVRDSSLRIPRFPSNAVLGFRWDPIEPQKTQGTLVQFLMVSWYASPLQCQTEETRMFTAADTRCKGGALGPAR